jgi:hypothetical protein
VDALRTWERLVIDPIKELKEERRENAPYVGHRVPAKAVDTKYSDELPQTPVRHGHDSSDPAGLWNPPGPVAEWPLKKRREGYGKVRRDS